MGKDFLAGFVSLLAVLFASHETVAEYLGRRLKSRQNFNVLRTAKTRIGLQMKTVHNTESEWRAPACSCVGRVGWEPAAGASLAFSVL